MKIRSDILRTYQALHTWTGITTGLLLFIGFFAGALTMFRADIDAWATPPSHKLAQVSAGHSDQLLHAVLHQYPKAAQSVTLSFDPNSSPIAWYEQGSDRGLRLDDQIWHGTLNAQGELVTQLSAVNELSSLLDYLHRTAGIFGEIGHDHAGVYVLGVAAFLYFIALVSGVIFLLPTLVKSFFAIRNKKTVSRFWLDSHNLIGITSLPFHIMIAFTVFVFAFHDLLYDGLAQVYDGKPLFERQPMAQESYHMSDLPSLSSLIAQAELYAPGYQVKELTLSGLNSTAPLASLRVEHGQELMRGPQSDFIFMNPYDFSISTSSVNGGDQGAWSDLVSSFFGLHFGSYGGYLGRWGYFIMGILGAALFYTGNLLWIEKRRKQKQASQAKSNQFMAKLTVGISLGSLLGVALCFAATKWLAMTTFNINMAYMSLYYVAFTSTLIASFYLGAAKTGIAALRALALLCFSLPVTSLLAVLLPNIGIWSSSSLATLALDITALVLAGVFIMMAKKMCLRAYLGEPNSIWFIAKPDKEPQSEQLASD